MPFVCVVKSESSCESRTVPIPAVTLMKNPAVRASAPEENSEQSRLTDAVRQREQVWQWIANVQQTVSRQGQLSLAWLTGVRNDLWTAYTKFNNFHNQVIALVPDDDIKEQAEVYHSFEQVFFNVASSVEEMKLGIHQPKSTDSKLEAINQNPSPSGRDVIIPANDSRKKENPLTSRFSKRCYATFERPSFFNKALPRQCQDTESDVHSRTQARKSSEKQTESIVVVPGKSTAAAEDVATNANLKSFAPNVIVCPNPPDDLIVGLPTSEQKRHQRDENSSCVLGDSSAKVKGLSLANHDLRRDHTDDVSKKMYVSSPTPAPLLSAVMPVPAEEYSPKDYRVNQDGGPIGENDPLLPPAVKAPDKIDQLYVTPSDYQPWNSCVPLECRQPCTNSVISKNLTTQFRINEAVIQSICQAIRERSLQPPVCVNLKTSRSCVPISHSESVASLLTSDKPIKPDIDGRCPPRRITACYTPNVDVCITFRLFGASSLKKLCQTDAPNQSTSNDKRYPTRIHIDQPPLKNSNNSGHSRGHTSNEFHKPRKERALKAPYAFNRMYHCNGPQPCFYWIDDEPPNNYETGTPLAEDDTIARILTRPWDPGTNSPTSIFTIVHIIIC